ncbi:hydroxyethylthiazole kinase [Aminipila butyrica]|uniref:Hydroxyethylthiazole kinase n=1 Tax=Aminipila butyrica TaxID=433296 RepID=A0A858BWD6_9FIRM|nr:hydroxyethylthiazole kinase [Aminipila butyrica]QIB69732.1 hydroxyethylthiazole kinase [Aminipila butyrica]
MFGNFIENVRLISPLVHNITNYVTVNDCANILLAAGASPIMADDIEEAADITSICSALNINIGTLNQNTIPAMFAAGKKANELFHPVILDPVGAGASALRTSTAKKLMEEIKFDVIRGNSSEIKTLAAIGGSTKGVDAAETDVVSEETLTAAIAFVKAYAEQMGTIVAVTGAIDIVGDKDTAYVIRNGRPEMGKITGTGCMLTCLIAAFLSANPQEKLKAAAAAVCAMGLAGEIAYKRLTTADGNATYRSYIIDAIYNLDGETLDKGARYAIR